MKKIVIIAVVALMALTACKEKGIQPTFIDELNLIASTTLENDYLVELYTETPTLEVGFIKFYMRLLDASGKTIEDATVSYHPLMDMGEMSHACPKDNPIYSSLSKTYEGFVVFTMIGEWELQVDVDGSTHTFKLDVGNSPVGTKYVASVNTSEGKYVLALVKPMNFTVGMNDFRLSLHKMATMMDFPMESDITFDFEPLMIDMGHGSPNNIAPTSTGGVYHGTANFTMSGDWQLNFTLKRDGEIIGEDFLTISF